MEDEMDVFTQLKSFIDDGELTKEEALSFLEDAIEQARVSNRPDIQTELAFEYMKLAKL